MDRHDGRGGHEGSGGGVGDTLHGIADHHADLTADWLMHALLQARRLGDEVVIASIEDALRHLERRHAPGNRAIERALRP